MARSGVIRIPSDLYVGHATYPVWRCSVCSGTSTTRIDRGHVCSTCLSVYLAIRGKKAGRAKGRGDSEMSVRDRIRSELRVRAYVAVVERLEINRWTGEPRRKAASLLDAVGGFEVLP